ncbi:uncharacterized protein LOC113875333 [Bos indicus x Bos taurus]|uniref:uncharacterized protein LOC113875333 n=1 Tax=Bos indicus x Bos taurus TaxID=30522 RepID=UPI000F7D1886|nr:uncharacterized protein LOC113875333 [Bos indicus x Bos taurus]
MLSLKAGDRRGDPANLSGQRAQTFLRPCLPLLLQSLRTQALGKILAFVGSLRLDSQNHPGSFNINLRSGCPWGATGSERGAPELARTQDPGSCLSSRSTHPPARALGPGGVVHVSERVPGGRAGRTRLGSPTGKTRFSRRRRRPGGNRLVAPASGRPGPQPPAQPHRSRRNSGRQLGSPGVTHSHARRAPHPQAPRPHLGSALGPGALTLQSFSGGGETDPEEGGRDPCKGLVA